MMRVRNLALASLLGALLALGLAVVLSNRPAPAEASPVIEQAGVAIDHSDAISRALAYLKTKQLPNGGIEGWVSGTADEFTTIKTVVALAAAHRPISFLTSVSGTTPLDYLAARAITYTHDTSGTLFPGRAGMLAVAVVAGDGDPYDFGGMNIISELLATYHPATGAYSTTAQQGWSSGAASTVNQLWAILGVATVQETVPVSATDFLIGLQEADGGWGWGAGGDVDTTALVVQALIASGNVAPDHNAVQDGLAFLRSEQAPSGGWESWGGLSADSTAAAIQALVAVGYTPATECWAAANGTPHTALAGLQAADGSFGGNALGTAHAIAGLAEAPLPVFGRRERANRALTWMNEQQNADGSWSGWSGPDPGATCDAALAYAAAGYDPATVTATGSVTSALDYLSSTASSYVYQSADAAGKLALAVEAAGRDAHSFGGVNIIDVLNNYWYSPTLGAFGSPTNTWHQAFAILGLAAAGEPIPVSATQTLTGLQQSDGGWKYDLSTSPWNTTTPDSTGLALQALIAAGVAPSDPSIVSGLAFLRQHQDEMGGWGNANSTAYAIQGLLAVGENPVVDWSSDAGHSPYDALAALQKADGPFVWSWSWPADNGLATWQAVPALLGVYYPYTPTAPLVPFAPVDRGLDPDRIVACTPRGRLGNSIDVVIPFGSDLDGDGTVSFTWRLDGGAWNASTIFGADGHYTATIPGHQIGVYDLKVTFSDPDGVQDGPTLTGSVTIHGTFMPIVVKGFSP
ncbi:MAG TPA: hypothetical protein EYH32_09770 [Anaerolineae bacterium]|nr:hypothetical protein [Anaerolineae bacterium]